ncbi:hypothetical protein ADZ36_06120 [Streptomyces fradiae]|uniref:Uncharacterized protein n=3 Tax=Streptomyces TaxID=1883 RepID=A0A420UXM4_9ACTN|nr:hypothetical protein ADZ36_06120 [Streptomyces fradiae]OFA37600.1 hypothetical protein BEN35_29000 [Streptomyces fradiae]RKM92464.1 hypothetical protein SFRA_023940 [Streptomyces xinghaiensis]RNC70431.1 hypothetical protein DC095_024930 [Streptomyces xinghaiensis]
MVMDRDEKPVVVTEIIRHAGRCDIIGEFRGPIRPHRVKHRVDLADEHHDPPIALAPLLPSLRELTGWPPEPADVGNRGPLVEGLAGRVAPGPSVTGPQAARPVPPVPPMPRLPDLTWDEQRRRAHGQALAVGTGERVPPSAKRRELDPDHPYAQFTDNLEHQLHKLGERPDEQAAVQRAAQEIRNTVSDLAARARTYISQRLRAAEGDPALLLQITLEPPLSGPFMRVAMNAVMRAIDTAEASVTSARAKKRVRAALSATVCTRPPYDPRGDKPEDFRDALVEFLALKTRERDMVAELLATDAQWEHFADMAARVEAATADPDPHPPAPRFADLEEVRAHLADVAERPLPSKDEPDPAGFIRLTLRERARRAGQLATEPTLELTPSRRLAIYGSAGDGWKVVAPGSSAELTPYTVKTRRHALRYTALLERLTDSAGNAYPWDADDYPPAKPFDEPPGRQLLHSWVTSTLSGTDVSFQHRLRRLRERSQAYDWMEDLSLYGFSDFDYIHPATPEELQPGDEVMFTFDQEELTYTDSLAGYFPPPRVENLAIGTATVKEDGTLAPGFWWPSRSPGQAQPLTHPVQLRDGARRPRPGEYTLHAGITSHLPELTHHQTAATTPLPLTAARPEGLSTGHGDPPLALGGTPETSSPQRGDEAPKAEGRPGGAPPAREETASDDAGRGTGAASAFREPTAHDRDAASQGSASSPDAKTSDPAGAPAKPEPGSAPVTAPDAGSAAASPAHRPEYPKVSQAQRKALFDIARGDITEVDGVFMQRTHRRTLERAASQKAVADVLALGLAERVGKHVKLSDHGVGWFTHHAIDLPASGDHRGPDPQGEGLPPIDYAPLVAFSVPEEAEAPRPPAPAPLPDDWYKIPHTARTPEHVQAAYGNAAEARDRAGKSTARDVAELAAGRDREDRWVWSNQHPLAQYDENAAAALERLTDPVEHAYATQAVLRLRAAIEAVGREAAADYVQRVRSAGSDPVAMDRVWRTTRGVQADDTYRFRVRGIVITYLQSVAAHTAAVGLDTSAIVDVLEDAAGWDGLLRRLGLKQVKYPHFPAAEQVAEAARFVANAVRKHALGETETVDRWAQRRATWHPVAPRPAIADPASATAGSKTATEPAARAEAGPAPEAAAPRSPAQQRHDESPPSQGDAAALEAVAGAGPSGTRADADLDDTVEEPPPMDQAPGVPPEASPGAPVADGTTGIQQPLPDTGNLDTVPGRGADAQPDEQAPVADDHGVEDGTPHSDAESSSVAEEAATAYASAREATQAWQRLVRAFAALDQAYGSWPRTSRQYLDLTAARRAVGILADQVPATPAGLSGAAYQLRELEWMLEEIRGDFERSSDAEFRERLGPALGELLEAADATHERSQLTMRQLSRDPSGTWLHPWVTEPPEGLQPITGMRPAGTAERPDRVVHADGTPLRHLGTSEESSQRDAVAVGAVAAPRGSGLWQVVRYGDTTHEIVHPALLHRRDTDPYPPPADLTMPPDTWAARWRRFDRAEATGARTAPVEALLVQPGDVVRIPNRKGERTVTRVEHGVRRGRGRQQKTTTVLWHTGPQGGTERAHSAKDQLEPIEVVLPPVHPGLTALFEAADTLTAPDAPAPAASVQAGDGTAQTSAGHHGSATGASPTSAENTSEAEEAKSDRPGTATREGGPGRPAALPQNTSAPRPGEDPGKPTSQGLTPAPGTAASARQKAARPQTKAGPPPAGDSQHSSVETAAPADTRSAHEPAEPPQSGHEDPGPALAYPDGAAYAAAHEGLLTELGRHERWLAATPDAAEAATALDATRAHGLPTLTALLTLRAATHHTAGPGPRTRLARLLDHHIQRTQLTMAELLLARAAQSTTTAELGDLHRVAYQGQFIALVQPTEAGEMEIGHYLQHRADQITQQTTRSQDPSEAGPKTAEEAAPMAKDTDDDRLLPALELTGDIRMTAEEAAPRLMDHARAHLAEGPPDVQQFAHIHGRPLYAVATQPEGAESSARVLYLSPTMDGGRAVHIAAHDLDAVSPGELFTAVTAWMDADDDGNRPLLDYGSAQTPTASVTAPSDGTPPAPAAPRQPDQPAAPRQPDQPAAPAEGSAAADTAEPPTAPAPPAGASPAPAGAAEQQDLAAAAASAAPAARAEEAPAGATTQQPGEDNRAPAPAPTRTENRPAPSPTTAEASPAPAGTAPGQDSGRHEKPGAPEQRAADTSRQPAPASTNPVDQLTALARTALADLGATTGATGTLVAPRTVLITLETSGNAERDRALADNLRAALQEAVSRHPDQSLATYRIDLRHTSQAGQPSLPASPAEVAPVPRERLIAANTEAAKIFAERLQNDPHAEQARTYLAQKRHLPPEVQQEWGLGYAPSDRGAQPKRWDVLCQELRQRGFTNEELLQAGLARRSSNSGFVYDYFDDRIIFPIHDERGDIVGFSGRRIDRPGETEEQTQQHQREKYLNTPATPLFTKGNLVFGLHHPAQAQALAESRGPRVSVEGYLDVIAVARAAQGLPIDQRPVVGAPMGTAFTEQQLTTLRALDTDSPRPHILFLDDDPSGRKVLLDKWDLLLSAAGPTDVTTAPDADAAQLWEEGVEANGDGAGPVLAALEQRQPLLDATVEAVLLQNADEGERASHAFDAEDHFLRTRAIAAKAAHHIRQAVHEESPGDVHALEQAACAWAKRLHQEWKIPGSMTATAVLLGPGSHDQNYENEVYEHALNLLADDPDGYFADDPDVRGRYSALFSTQHTAPTTPAAASPNGTQPAPRADTPAVPGQWPTGARRPALAAPAGPTAEQPAAPETPSLTMCLPGPPDGQLVELTDRTTAAWALHTAVHDRLGRHAAETPQPDRLPQPVKLGTVHGIDLSTSGDDQTTDDPTVVLWLGLSRSSALRLSYSRLTQMTGPELLAAVEWRAAQASGQLGAPLSAAWRNAVRSIIPSAFPARPTPAQLADLLDTIAAGLDGSDNEVARRAEQALALYTAGYDDLALDHLAGPGHIWVLRNDGSWAQEEAPGTSLTWDELNEGFRREAAAIGDVTQAATALPMADAAADPSPLAADLTVAHHSVHEAVGAMRPYSIGLPGTIYQKITALVDQMDAAEPAMRRLRGPDGERLMNRAKTSFVRVLEALATVASKIRLTGLSTRLERTVARLRGQDLSSLPVPPAVRTDRGMQDLAHIERDLERRMAAPTTKLAEYGELQEQWIINRARWRARYEQLHGQPPEGDFLPDNGLVAGAPPIPNPIVAHTLLLERLNTRVAELRDTNPHTGKQGNANDPTADLLNGVAWACQQRLVGTVPTGPDPEGPIPAAQLRQSALTVTAHRDASPLTLRRAMNVSAERADRLLQRLEGHQILGPYRANAPRTVQARPADIDAMLARPPAPPAARPRQPSEPAPTAEDREQRAADPEDLDTRIEKAVSKYLADRQERGKTRGGNDSADGTTSTPRTRKPSLREAEANALAAGQHTPFAPSQS